MSYLSRFYKTQAVDPVFGPLTLGRSGWDGEARSPSGKGTVLVSVERGIEGPVEEDRESFKALGTNYVALEPQLKACLFALWEPGLAEPMWEESWPTTSDALWSMLELSSLTIRNTSKIELLFTFKGEVWPDAMFVVEVNGMNVVPLSLDD